LIDSLLTDFVYAVVFFACSTGMVDFNWLVLVGQQR